MKAILRIASIVSLVVVILLVSVIPAYAVSEPVEVIYDENYYVDGHGFIRTSDGAYWVAFVQRDVSGISSSYLKVAHSSDGVTWDIETVISGSPSEVGYVLNMTVYSDDNIVMFYSEYENIEGSDYTYIYTITYNGSSWGAPQLVITDYGTEDYSFNGMTADDRTLQVAVDSNDDIHLLIANYYGDYYHVYQSSGAWQTLEEIDSYGTEPAGYTDSLVVTSTKTYFFYTGSIASPGLHMKTKTGGTLSGDTVISDAWTDYDYVSKPIATVGTDGTTVYLVCLGYITDTDEGAIFITHTTNGGTSWSTPIEIYREDYSMYSGANSIAIDRTGIISVFWVNNDDYLSYYAQSADNYITHLWGDEGWNPTEQAIDGYYPRVSGISTNRIASGVATADVAGSGVFVYAPAESTGLSVVTNAAANITTTTALLQGSLTNMGGAYYVGVQFEYGLTTSYGSTTYVQSETSVNDFGSPITGLTLGTTYHYRAKATAYIAGVATVAYGDDVSFTTLYTAGGSTILAIKNAKVFTSYKATGDYLFTAEMLNNYTGYAPSEKPGDYFQMQLIATDHTTILAATPLASWGDRPESIYVNPTVAAILTFGSAYYIKMIGVGISGTPYEEYQLLITDWKGSDLTKLDYWCRGTAINMQINDGRNDYLDDVNNRTVITDAASTYFNLGLPGINQIRPNLFATQQQSVDGTGGTSLATWDSGSAWSTNVGTAIATDAATMGAPFGIDGKAFLGGVIMLGMLGCIMIVVSGMNGVGALGALLLAIPMLWYGTYMKIIPIIVIMIICIIFGMFAIRQFVVKTL